LAVFQAAVMAKDPQITAPPTSKAIGLADHRRSAVANTERWGGDSIADAGALSQRLMQIFIMVVYLLSIAAVPPVAFDAEGQAHACRRMLLGDFKERGLALRMKPAVSQS
jgi:hypothetical protein